MGKYEKKQAKKPAALTVILLVILVISAAVFALFALPRLLGDRNDGTVPSETAAAVPTEPLREETAPSETVKEIQIDSLSFPLTLANGKLEIESLFQFTGINPDAANREGVDIASILLKNTSDTYLEKADITLTASDGTALNFTVTHLPAGKSAMAFSLEHLSIEADAACTDAACSTVFGQAEALITDEQVSVSVEGTRITLTNHTDEALSNLVVYCRSPFGEDYFGGITYQYTVSNLPAKGSTDVHATDCILGMAEVVQIATDQ